MADELCVPAVAPPPVRQIKCFQLFFGGDGGASGVGFGVAAAWSFCFLGFAGGSEAVSRADGGGAAFSSDVFYFSGCRAKLLVLYGDSDEVFFLVCPVRVYICCAAHGFGSMAVRFWSSELVPAISRRRASESI